MAQTTSKFRVIKDSSIYNNTKCSSYGDDVLMVDTSGGIYLGNETSTPDLIANVSNIQAVDTSETLDDVSGVTYVKYVAQTLTEVQKAQARTNIGALSANDQVTVDLSNYYTKGEIDSQLGDINTILESIISGGGN